RSGRSRAGPGARRRPPPAASGCPPRARARGRRRRAGGAWPRRRACGRGAGGARRGPGWAIASRARLRARSLASPSSQLWSRCPVGVAGTSRVNSAAGSAAASDLTRSSSSGLQAVWWATMRERAMPASLGWAVDVVVRRPPPRCQDRTMSDYQVDSEIGRLRKVLLHRPDLELTRLTPANIADMLFAEIMWAARARLEHQAFADVLRSRGVEVLLLADLLATALADEGGRKALLYRVVPVAGS